MNINFLRIPLGMLYGMRDIDSFSGLPQKNVELIQRDYTPEEVIGIKDALKYAVENPDFDFKAQFPELTFTNRQVHGFLVKIHRSIETFGQT